jgi:hypothetical protein
MMLCLPLDDRTILQFAKCFWLRNVLVCFFWFMFFFSSFLPFFLLYFCNFGSHEELETGDCEITFKKYVTKPSLIKDY